MQVQFIDASLDERYANTSVLVTVPGPDGPTHVLLDCGFTAAAAYYRTRRGRGPGRGVGVPFPR